MRRFLVILLSFAPTLGGCASGPRPRGLDDPDPAVRIRAIRLEAERGRQANLPRLVEQLEDDDPAVRLAATESLRRLTGQTHGFVWFQEPSRQTAAVNAWRVHVGLPLATQPATLP